VETAILIGVVVAVMVLRLGFVWSQGYRARKAVERGMIALEQGDFPEAEQALKRCVKLAPIYAPARRVLGRCLAAQQKYTEAEEQIRFASDLEPRNSEGHLELAVFLSRCPPQRFGEALDALEKAVEIQPELAKQLLAISMLEDLHGEERFQALVAS
jgi:tetratricopeptide (TPR) repeat protein